MLAASERQLVVEAQSQNMRLIGRVQHLVPFIGVLPNDPSVSIRESNAIGKELGISVGQCPGESSREPLIHFRLERIVGGNWRMALRRCSRSEIAGMGGAPAQQWRGCRTVARIRRTARECRRSAPRGS